LGRRMGLRDSRRRSYCGLLLLHCFRPSALCVDRRRACLSSKPPSRERASLFDIYSVCVELARLLAGFRCLLAMAPNRTEPRRTEPDSAVRLSRAREIEME
jgi:hypothetical protein